MLKTQIKMKTLAYNKIIALALITLFYSTQLLAQGYVEKTKEIKKSFNLTGKTTLGIENKYGNIHINTWDKKQINVVVKIVAKKKNVSAAEKLINQVDINITGGGNSKHIKFETEINGNINNRNNEKFSINYTVYMPLTSPLKITNKYGNVYIDELNAPLDLVVKYGSINLSDIHQRADIDLRYGNGEVEKMADVNLDISYSNIGIEACKKIDCESKYSNLKFGKVVNMDISNKYGNVDIEEVSNIVGESNYGNLKIDDLYKSLKMSMAYGGGLKVRNVSRNFTRVEISSKYTSSELSFESGVSAKVISNTRYGKLKYDEDKIRLTHVDIDHNVAQLEGVIGKSENPKSLIKVTASYGNVRLDLD